jgi:hypothetical protein
MHRSYTHPFELTQDVNGKPIPRWQEWLEALYTDNVPFGEILSLVRYLLDENAIEAIMGASDEEIMATVKDPEKLAADMRALFEEAVKQSRAASN